MNYKFPHITHIDQVRDAIKWHTETFRKGTKSEFIEAERDGFHVFNYLVSLPDTFPDAEWESGKMIPSARGVMEFNENAIMLRECRGLTFYDGSHGELSWTVAARKFHKFFNAGEKYEVDMNKVDVTVPHTILDKLDGSMITPFQPDLLHRLGTDASKLEWHTKMGKTDTADMALPFIEKNQQYARYAAHVMASNYTPIFEFCSRKNRIVIDHPKDRLILLAMRHNETGEYIPYEEMRKAETHGIEVVQYHEGSVENMTKFVEETRTVEDVEGYVVRFDSGHMLKVKGDWYCTLHKAVSSLAQEKDVWKMILTDNVDDIKGALPEDQRDRLDKFQSELTETSIDLADDLLVEFDVAIAALDKEDFEMFDNAEAERKKMFAVKHVQDSKLDLRIRNLMFSLYDGKDAWEVVKAFLIKQTSSGTKVEKVRDLVNGLKWEITEE